MAIARNGLWEVVTLGKRGGGVRSKRDKGGKVEEVVLCFPERGVARKNDCAR